MTTEPKAAAAPMARPGRFARRMVVLLLVSALLPLALAVAYLADSFARSQQAAHSQELGRKVRSAGMEIIGRIDSADAMLRGVLAGAGGLDPVPAVQALPWVQGALLVDPASAATDPPQPDARQRAALAGGSSVLLWSPGADGALRIWLVRAVSPQSLLYAQVRTQWLEAVLRDEVLGDGLLVLAPGGIRIAAAGSFPAGLGRAAAQSPEPPGWNTRSWELFLRGQYAAPSWRVVVASRSIPPFEALRGTGAAIPLILVFTGLLVALLSMIAVRRQLQPLQVLREATRRLARRDFSRPLRIAAGDEFGELAKSFNELADKLRAQFLALESLSAVDRLLLQAPDMEQILDTLMPRMAAVLGCEALCVVLVDADSPGQSRIYDFQRMQQQVPPVRRVAGDLAELRHDAASQSVLVLGEAVAQRSAVLARLHEGGARHFEVRSLQHEGEVHGYLCLGWTGAPAAGDANGVGAGDFADRLSLVLASVERSQRLLQRANYDPLTNLPNRRMFIDQAESYVSRASATRGKCAFLYVDLDRFKRINDTSGHWIGDELLRCVAGRLKSCMGERALASRLAGDEFVVLLPELADAGAAMQLAERIIARLQEPIVIGRRSLQVGASIGIAVAPADGRNAEELLRNADIAMYRAKESGRGRAVFFESDMQRRVQDRLSIESGIHRALRDEEFKLHYQPIVSTLQRGAVAVEALLRWPGGPRDGLNMPAVFIPVAEDSGLIVGLGEWVMRTACRQLRQWRTDEVPVDHVSVNVSARQLGESGFLATTLRVLQECGLEPHELQLEITESVLADGEAVAGVLRDAAAAGIRLALDDFGTGYSSLSYLRQYPIRTLKIDRSFVTGIPGEPEACRLVESILAMATALGRDVVAEGVETEAQRDFLAAAGCTGFQGYLYGRPMEAGDIPGFTRRIIQLHRNRGATSTMSGSGWSAGATTRIQRPSMR